MKSSGHDVRYKSGAVRTGLVLIGVILALGLGIGAWLASHRGQPPSRRVDATDTPVARNAAGSNINGLPPAAVAENFTRARTQAERLQWVRQPTQVAAAMAEFFRNGRGARETVATLKAMKPAEADAAAFERFGVTMADGSQRLLCVVTSAGEPKVDFKAYARHGSVPWEDLLAGLAKEASEMRVFIQKGDYYNYEFKHDVRWQNFIATSPDLEAPVQLYIARNEPAAKLLEKLDTQRPMRATIALRALGESHLKRQFEITRFLGAGWVLED
ncbi:MAG: hypothetical protein NTW21_19235 [Verrucomicrobia bacterium]|nr:hypothetical protein [Verrucomicrobiota bacterium]